MIIPVNLKDHSYDIQIERGALGKAGSLFRLDRKVLVLTDNGVPAAYARTIAAQCKEAYIEMVPAGEESKSFPVLQHLLEVLLQNRFSRGDCVVSVGGGVVSDLGGFTASVYMRGIDHYTVPTTVLSQVDASVGGKTAINFQGYKNIIGAFYQPKAVLIDPDTLKTLPDRQIRNGLVEALKMALTMDRELFEQFEKQDPLLFLDQIISRSVQIKRNVVEQDEKEAGLRRVLNFGHTIGHGIESTAEGTLYHGECVALGMIPMCEEPLRSRLIRILAQMGLKTSIPLDSDKVEKALLHDKKTNAKGIAVVKSSEPGTFFMETARVEELRPLIKLVVRG